MIKFYGIRASYLTAKLSFFVCFRPKLVATEHANNFTTILLGIADRFTTIMQALTHHTHLTTSHIHSLLCSIPRTMDLPHASSSAFNPPLSTQTLPSPSNSSSNSARSTPSTLTDEKKSRKRKSVTDLERPVKRKLAAEVPNFMRDRVVSAASLTEEMLKQERLEQALREKIVNHEEEADSTVIGTQKQQSICKVCGDVAFGKHYVC